MEVPAKAVCRVVPEATALRQDHEVQSGQLAVLLDAVGELAFPEMPFQMVYFDR